MRFQFKDTFFKIVGLNSISMLLKILMGLVSTKLVSFYLGVQGINTLEFFRNFTTASNAVAQGGIQNGIIKNFALSSDKQQNQRILTTSVVLMWAITFIIAFFIFLFRSLIQNYLFQSDEFENLILLYLLFLPFIAIQTVTLGYLQGKQFFKKVILINCLGYLLNIILAFLLIINGGLKGAMLQIIITPFFIAFLSVFAVRKSLKGYAIFSLKYFDKGIAKNFLDFSLMNVCSSLLTPVSFILIRSFIVNHLDTTEAGIWSSVVRLSGFYMLFISSLCSLYFFPKLSKDLKPNGQKKVVTEYFVKFVPIVLVGLLFCFILQKYIVLFVYNEDFLAITEVFYLQLVADLIKTCSLIFGYFFVVHQKTRYFIFFEFISTGLYIGLSFIFISTYGLKGSYFALIASLLVYLFITAVGFKKLNV
ncbi:Polysaccharide biosynthesis protein [Paenimyroides aquimaris]|uniref:Polysaccharide biosynthesis protein n=1 Tax=Paenimyroides marinum TaxID=1159016 RepID=A0A1H6K6Z2_9FLAO|nr:oligosaccharide flippase family protein [Paenimyroides aquimaris]SEH68212.1 Polysaccharide biosynthesis protein [Paenimyroides aquimaris]